MPALHHLRCFWYLGCVHCAVHWEVLVAVAAAASDAASASDASASDASASVVLAAAALD